MLNLINHFIKTEISNYFKTLLISNTAKLLHTKTGNIKEELLETVGSDKEYEAFANRYFGHSTFHNCFIIHPYVKWGPQKVKSTNPLNQLQEAIALIRTLAHWKVQGTVAVPLLSLHKKTVFGSGTLEKLKNQIRGNPNITSVFINVGTLRNVQLNELEMEFNVPILDRYKIVMQILKLHAISTHARLQVALAELPYIRSRIRKEDFSLVSSNEYDTRKLMLQNREHKLKSAIKLLHSQRQLLRNRRVQLDYPVIAIVGYTNSGKTSLIKALTGDQNLQPRNHLFATLDVTMHLGQLPSTLKVLYVDTVGFISDIPTTLIECFVVTLEDAMLADIIVHVEDLSSEDLIHQRNHVLSTLENLANKTGSQRFLEKIITVGNKFDLVPKAIPTGNSIMVSATTQIGIDRLSQKLEEAVLEVTKRKIVTIKVPSGGKEMRWLYKNSAVTSMVEDQQDSQYQYMTVIVTKTKLAQFQHYFIKQKQ